MNPWTFNHFQTSPTREFQGQLSSASGVSGGGGGSSAQIPGCLSSNEPNPRRKGDFVLQTGHVIEIVTKLFLVIQNATGKPPNVNIATEFEANFGSDSVPFTFRPNHAAAAGGGSVGGSGGSDGSAAVGPGATVPSTPVAGGAGGGGHVKLVKRGTKFEVLV